jgi:hypothetical protein
VIVPLIWLLFPIPTLDLLIAPLALGGVVVNATRRAWISSVLIVVLSPFTLFFLLGIHDYSDGTARLRSMGMAGLKHWSLDSTYRCPRMTGGCVSHGGDWMRDEPYNAAVKVMILTFGPMAGSYVGPYPTQQEASEALKQGNELQAADIDADRILLGNAPVSLASGVGRGLLIGTEWASTSTDAHWAARLSEELGPIIGSTYQGGCVVLRIPMRWSGSAGTQPARAAVIVLIDASSGWPFAFYTDGQCYYRPRVRWSK